MASPPECGKWSEQEVGLLGDAKNFVADMCAGHVDAERRAQLHIKHDAGTAELQAAAVSSRAAAKTSWRQWAANAVDAGASAAHAYLRRADANIESESIRISRQIWRRS